VVQPGDDGDLALEALQTPSRSVGLSTLRPTPSPRLHLLQAQGARIGVIFRRGPSKHVELVRWDMSHDDFERGQWFHGRIYERRSDLSPDGELLLYFASKFSRRTTGDREYTYAWTAVSKPPWLTAIALWPKGDCWHGGGLFLGPRRLMLNHKPDVAEPHPEHRPPRQLKVEPNPDAHGENEPIYARRLTRDGWEVEQEWDVEFLGPQECFRTTAPDIRVRRHPDLPLRIVMTRRLDGLRYSERFDAEGPLGSIGLPPPRLDWVDWDYRGRLIVLTNGRVLVADTHSTGVNELRELIDLTGDQPEPREAPAAAHCL
jgi:hypothetical protein